MKISKILTDANVAVKCEGAYITLYCIKDMGSPITDPIECSPLICRFEGNANIDSKSEGEGQLRLAFYTIFRKEKNKSNLHRLEYFFSGSQITDLKNILNEDGNLNKYFKR